MSLQLHNIPNHVRTLLLLMGVLCCKLTSYAQDLPAHNLKPTVDDAAKRQQHNYEQDAQSKATSFAFKPYVGVSFGLVTFFGDVRASNFSIFSGEPSLAFTASAALNEEENYLLTLGCFFGSLVSRQTSLTSPVDNVNFYTKLSQYDLSFTYQLSPLFDGLIRPFVALGVGVVSFRPKGNLKDSDGSYYHYQPNTPVTFNDRFETDLRRKDLYGAGDYPLTSPVIPVSVGGTFKISDYLYVKISYKFTYTFTDMMDNVSGKVAAAGRKVYDSNTARALINQDYSNYYNDAATPPAMRAAALKTNSINDMYGTFHFGIQIRPFASERFIKKAPPVYVGTEKTSISTTYQKIFLDDENDGPKSVFISTDGSSTSVSAAPRSDGKPVTIPRKFRKLDLNKDGYISEFELNAALEDFLDGYSKYNTREIIDLKRFYYKQPKR
ncbi:MAG: hypothetical protein LBK47_08645 [Prevotellaceae bacterium]|jgi:hypothetical protein|nr:hypothetical protein [Prevotellaceae bacterium]